MMTKEIIPEDHNVIFITLDSCRWDTYQAANTPNLDKIGIMRKAETPGSYTVPAHVSFFSSHLPKVIDESGEDYYTKDGAPLWKLKNIGRDAEMVGVLLDGYDIFDGYRNK